MEVVAMVTVEFVESPFNYIQWRAMDIAGNGFTASPSYRVPVDATPLVFFNFTPLEDDIQNTSLVQCWVTAWDGEHGSGVDLSSIEFRVDVGESPFSTWTSAGMEGGDVQSRFSVWSTCSDGMNLLQFRGQDRAGNGPWESLEFSILVDTTGPVFPLIEPSSENKQASSMVEVIVRINDSLSGVDDGRAFYQFCQVGGDLPDEWSSLDILEDGDGWVARFWLDLTEGNSNMVRFRAFDILGNEGISETRSIWVNSKPRAVITGGETENDGNIIRFSAEDSFDPDGDDLSYAWYIDNNSQLLGTNEILTIDTYKLPSGNYTLTLVVMDDIKAEDRDEHDFSVEPEKPPTIMEDDFNPLFVIILLFVLVIILLTFYVKKK